MSPGRTGGRRPRQRRPGPTPPLGGRAPCGGRSCRSVQYLGCSHARRLTGPLRAHLRQERTMANGPRVAVIGLDCGTPQLLFDRLSDEVPNINALMQRGMHGDLASITPPITIPAWACAMSGKTPGQLAIYGMRNRKDTTYEGLSIATSLTVKEPQVWDVLGERGLRSLLIGVPPGYPPKPLNGWRLSCFLTPPSAPTFTYPEDLAGEVRDELGGQEYVFDIPNFREQGYDHVHDQLFTMTER